MSTHRWFATDDTRSESMQRVIYPLMIMERFNTNECVFNFQVFDSGNGTRRCFSRYISKKEAIARASIVIHQYLEHMEL